MRRRIENPPVEIVWLSEDDDNDNFSAAWKLGEESSINILSHMQAMALAVHEGYPVGAMFSAVSNDDDPEYSFDIVIAEGINPAVKMGAFIKLIHAAMSEKQDLEEVYPDLRYNLYVVAEYAKLLLEREGFVVEEEMPRGDKMAYMMTRD